MPKKYVYDNSIKRISAIKAFLILGEISPMQAGFNIFKLPSAEYLLDCINTIQPTHEIFFCLL